MRFGAHFRSVVDPAFAEYELPYKGLKKRIKRLNELEDEYTRCSSKDLTDPSDPDFKDMELDGADTMEHEGFPTQNAEDMQHEFINEIVSSIERLNQLVAQELAGAPPADQLERLRAFAELNRIGIVKIIKKYNKKVGHRDELQQAVEGLVQQPFVTLLSQEVLADLESAGGALVDARRPSIERPSGVDTSGSIVSELRERIRLRLHGAMHVEHLRMRLFMLQFSTGMMLFCVGLMVGNMTGWASVIKAAGLLLAFMSCVLKCLHSVLDDRVEPKPKPRPLTVQRCWERLSLDQLPSEGQRRQHTINATQMIVHLATKEAVTGAEESGAWAEMTTTANCHASVTGPRPNTVGLTFGEDFECICCFSGYNPGQAVALLPCGHMYHEQCIIAWAVTDTTAADKCPVCRADFSGRQQLPAAPSHNDGGARDAVQWQGDAVDV
jgi:hypothetical protein